MKLTNFIFDRWKIWMSLPSDTVDWVYLHEQPEERDGLIWHDGYWAEFWYMLNLSWFKMNNKISADRNETRPYVEPRDFELDLDY